LTHTRVLCVAIIIVFLLFAFVNFTKSLTPYVTFAQAKSSRGSVQVRGTIETSGALSRQSDGRGSILRLRDEAGEVHQVIYRGALPDGVDKAESLVVVGKYEGSAFMATKVLTKCPTKYQEHVSK